MAACYNQNCFHVTTWPEVKCKMAGLPTQHQHQRQQDLRAMFLKSLAKTAFFLSRGLLLCSARWRCRIENCWKHNLQCSWNTGPQLQTLLDSNPETVRKMMSWPLTFKPLSIKVQQFLSCLRGTRLFFFSNHLPKGLSFVRKGASILKNSPIPDVLASKQEIRVEISPVSWICYNRLK